MICHPTRHGVGVNLCSAAAAGCAPHGARTPCSPVWRGPGRLPPRGRPVRRPARHAGRARTPSSTACAVRGRPLVEAVIRRRRHELDTQGLIPRPQVKREGASSPERLPTTPPTRRGTGESAAGTDYGHASWTCADTDPG